MHLSFDEYDEYDDDDDDDDTAMTRSKCRPYPIQA